MSVVGRCRSVVRQSTRTAVAVAATKLAWHVLQAHPPGGAVRWERTNHRGEPVSLLAGPAFVLGALAGVGCGPGRVPLRAAAALAGAAAGALGGYDDLAEQQVRKGLAGHLGALARGEVTTGAVKVLGLAVSGLAASALVGPALVGPGRSDGRGSAALDVLVGGAVVAGSANLVNLLDLRPGRALKAVLLAAPATGAAGACAALAVGGAASALIEDDLAERTMLGDTGANAAGAMLGVAALAGAGRRSRWALLAALTALTVASEKVSFTRVIESTPVLRELDAAGRRPAPMP